MSQQEEGWPLGLHPLNVRVGFGRNGDFSGSVSFNTLLTGSPTSSTDSSSDLDTQSTGSFFHDRSITLGSLIGVSNILELSRKSSKVRKVETTKEKKRSSKPKTWFLSLCSRDTTDAAETGNNPPSLGHFLAVERRAAANEFRRNHNNNQWHGIYDEISLDQSINEANSLFVNGHIAPPTRLSSCHGEASERGRNGEFDEGRENGVPLLFSCMCGQNPLCE